MRDGLRENINHMKSHEEGMMKRARGKIVHCSTEALEQVEKCRKSSRERYDKLKKVLEDASAKVSE